MDNLPSIQRFNENAIAFTIGGSRWFWSYNTCVAYQGPEGRARRDHNYSTTTTRHLAYMGVADWPRVDDETFERLATGGDR